MILLNAPWPFSQMSTMFSQLVKQMAAQEGITEQFMTLADDGYTGTNYDRPSFKEMSADIEKGLVKTVIVKDLSRFGRNYIEVGPCSLAYFIRYSFWFTMLLLSPSRPSSWLNLQYNAPYPDRE